MEYLPGWRALKMKGFQSGMKRTWKTMMRKLSSRQKMMQLFSPSHKHCREHMMLLQQHREKGRPAGNVSNTIQAIVHKPKKGGQRNGQAFGYLEKKFLYQISSQKAQKHHLKMHTILQMTWMRELLSQKRQVIGILSQILQFISTEASEREEAHQRREASQAGDCQERVFQPD